MKVFISWSGATSRIVATALREWLPYVLQAVEPYVSSEDIQKGARWGNEISKELKKSLFGIICVTPDNISAPWLNFEAGALSRELDSSQVSPLLFGLDPASFDSPIKQFQCTIYDESDVRRLVHSLNRIGDKQQVREKTLDNTFEQFWPKLKEQLDPVLESSQKAVKFQSEEANRNAKRDDLLSEAVSLLRHQEELLLDPSGLLPPEYLHSIIRQVPIIVYRGDIDHDVYLELAKAWQDFYDFIANQRSELIPKSIIRDKLDCIAGPLQELKTALLPNAAIACFKSPSKSKMHTDAISRQDTLL